MQSNKGKKLVGLLEEAPRPPRMRGLPKTHKPGIPMRPITSGIGSAPHRLAKCLAKPLSRCLGTLSNGHLKNSGELIGRLKNVDFAGKVMVSYDVTALFTHVSVEGALIAAKEAIGSMDDQDLPVGKNDLLKLISLCIKFGPFMFNNEEYCQIRGLAMGSPLSAVLASLYMEVLERDHYMKMIGRGTHWFSATDHELKTVPVDCVTPLKPKLTCYDLT
ncbi:uncharacterized protein LOC143021963 [Oratosquilla oratoria]|uniref:uncharacterized protein LOC143021963 n=1 Tax=Oratosquilla oratoria TaxID=337810 RepID=UPI003F758299